MDTVKCWECIYEYLCDWSENENGDCKMFREAKDDCKESIGHEV